MSALLVVCIGLALGLAAGVTAAMVLLPLWVFVCKRAPGLVRLHVGVAAVPWVIGGVAALAVLVPGDPHTGEFLACHCAEQAAWSHLCALHPWSSAGLVWPAGLLLIGLLPGVVSRAIRLGVVPLGRGGGAEPKVIDLPEPVALLHGWLWPGLVVDRSLWHDLGPQERAVVVAHERGHLERKDPAVLMLLRVLVLLVPDRVSTPFLSAWLARAERRADAAAASRLGDPVLVAEVLVRTARRGVAPWGKTPGGRALGWTGGSIDDRVHSLLAAGEAHAPATPDVSWVDAVLVALLGLMGLTTVPWLHHQLEHLLNLVP